MKWIVLILVLTNLMVYLYGLKQVASDINQVPEQHETLNGAAMTVIAPDKKSVVDNSSKPKISQLQEAPLAQLNIDEKGKVLQQTTMQTNTSAGIESLNNIQMDETLDSVLMLPGAGLVAKKTEILKSKPTEPVAITQAPEKPTKLPQEKPTCYTFGPFSDQRLLTKVQRAFELDVMDYELITLGKKNKIKGVRVFMGPFASSADLKAQQKELSEDKVDHFVVSIDGTLLIQLGYFSDFVRAKDYQQRLKKRNFEAKAALIFSQTSINTVFRLAKTTRKMLEEQSQTIKVSAPIKACS